MMTHDHGEDYNHHDDDDADDAMTLMEVIVVNVPTPRNRGSAHQEAVCLGGRCRSSAHRPHLLRMLA